MHQQGYSDALAAVQRRLGHLPARVHTDDPRTAFSRLYAFVMDWDGLDYGDAVHATALAVALVAAIDRAENARVDTGTAA